MCYHKIVMRSMTNTLYTYFLFFFDPRKVKSNEGKSVCLHQGYWICWKCVEQMIAQLPPRKNRLGLEAAARLAYHRYRCCIFSLFPPLDPRIVERTKFTGYKALPEKVSRAQSPQTSPLSSRASPSQTKHVTSARKVLHQAIILLRF